MKAGNIEMPIAIQNTIEMYGSQLLENPNAIGLMVPSVADHYKI